MTQKIEAFRMAIAALPRKIGPNLLMERLLEPGLAAMPELLEDKSKWKSLYIDYEPPFLMRLSRSICVGQKGSDAFREVYVSAHYFFGVPGTGASDKFGLVNPYSDRPELIGQESLNNYHPHPWAASFYQLEGRYLQEIGRAEKLGYNELIKPIPHDLWEQDAHDPGKSSYAFNDPLIWHRVMPNDGKPVSSLMFTYIPEDWGQVGPKPPIPQRSLYERENQFMFEYFGELFQQLHARPKPQFKPAGRSLRFS